MPYPLSYGGRGRGMLFVLVRRVLRESISARALGWRALRVPQWARASIS